MQVDTLIHAKWIIPVEPENAVYEDHSIAIREDRIEALLPTAAARAEYSARSEIALGQHALIPGLINAHTHAAMNLLRGLANDLPLMQVAAGSYLARRGPLGQRRFCPRRQRAGRGRDDPWRRHLL